MTNNTLIQPEEIIHLSGISWQTYETLLTELSYSQRLRHLPLAEISSFLQQIGQKDYLELVKEFRDWIKSQIRENEG